MSEADCEGAKFEGAIGLGARFMKKWQIKSSEEEKKQEESK